MAECPVACYQSKVELDWLLAQYRALKPNCVLEVGSLYGGTLWYWMQNSQPGTRFVSIDLIPDNKWHKAVDVIEARKLWDGWAEESGMGLQSIIADSTATDTIKLMALAAPFDFIFVDGGHDRRTVQSDFANYWPMLRPGGLMAFHDVAYDLDNPHCIEVGEWWRSLAAKNLYKMRECVETPGIWGIGVIEK